MAGFDPLIDTVALAAWLGVSPATIRSWAYRGRLERRGHDARGRVLYSAKQAAALMKPADQHPA